jgi:hypothetical protein
MHRRSADTITNLSDETLATGTAGGIGFDTYNDGWPTPRSPAGHLRIARLGNWFTPACSRIGRNHSARDTTGLPSHEPHTSIAAADHAELHFRLAPRAKRVHRRDAAAE